MQRYPGVVTGVVKSLEDPEGQGRVRLEFPWLQQSYRSAWASIATPLAGKKRGMYFMPELEDEVLIAFNQGDFDHPFVIGFLWNGVDDPPAEDINLSVRRIKTVSGHTVDFDDNDGKEKIHIKTQGGHEIEMSDELHLIKIRSNDGQEVLIDDEASEIKLSNNVDTTTNTVTMDASGITIDTTKAIKITGDTVQVSSTSSTTVESTGATTVKGSQVLLNP